MSKTPDDVLFDEGLPYKEDFLLKAQLRVKVRKSPLPVMQELLQTITETYNAHLDTMMHEIDKELGKSVTKSSGLYVMSGGRGSQDALRKALGASQTASAPASPASAASAASTVQKPKAAPSGPPDKTHVKAPGSRGGKFYRNKHGDVIYGTKPSPSHPHEASPEDVVGHYKKWSSPTPFLGPGDDAEAVHAAVVESGYMDEADLAFLEWWQDDALDAFLETFGYKLKDLDTVNGDFGKLQFPIGDRDVSMGEAVQFFFEANSECFAFDDDADIGEYLAETFEHYEAALADPNVQKLVVAQQKARLKEEQKWYIKAESLHSAYEPFVNDILTNPDNDDVALKSIVAMAQMDMLVRPGKGETSGKGAAKFKGLIVPNHGLVDPKDGALAGKDAGLDRLNGPQLMAAYMATRLQTWSHGLGAYTPTKADGFLGKHEEKLLGLVLDAHGIQGGSVEADTVRDRLEEAASSVAFMCGEYNTGKNPYVKAMMEMPAEKTLGNPDALSDFTEQIIEHKQLIADALAAQKDENFALPETMQSGVWGAAGKDTGEDHQINKKTGKPWAPFPHQAQTVNWMNVVKRGIIALDAGMGKTPAVIAFMENLRSQGKGQRGILFLPPSLMNQWPKEIAQFAPDSADKILNLDGLSLAERKAALQSDLAEKAHYILISSGTLNGEKETAGFDLDENDGTGGTDGELSEILANLDGAVFIDEAHQGGYKNKNGTRHQIARKVMHEDREYAFGLTATPVPNDPMDLYHLTDLFHPGSVGDQDNWEGKLHGVDYNESTKSWDVSHPENIAELHDRIKPFVFYKSITDPVVQEGMNAQLPDKLNEWKGEDLNRDLPISHAKMNNGMAQHDYFKAGGYIDHTVAVFIKQKIADWKADKSLNPDDVQKKMMSLPMMAGAFKTTLHRQASISPALIDPSYKRADGKTGYSPKLHRMVKDMVTHFKTAEGEGGGKPIVCFSSIPGKAFPHVKQALAEAGIDPSLIGTISGSVSAEERGYLQDTINAGHQKILLVGTMSGGAGLNLQKSANTMMFLDEPWSPSQKRQAQGRVWRTGQTNPLVKEYAYRTMETNDMHVEQRVAGKQVMVSALLSHKPDQETFAGAASEGIEQLLGRVKGTDWTPDQIAKIHANMASLELSHLHEDVSAVSEMAVQQHSGVDKKAQKKLKGTPVAEAFDQTIWRREWQAKQGKSKAKQSYAMHQLMENLSTEKGDETAAASYKKKAHKLAKKYPELDGGKAFKTSAKAVDMSDSLSSPKAKIKTKGNKKPLTVKKKTPKAKAAKPGLVVKPKKGKVKPHGVTFLHNTSTHAFNVNSNKKVKGSDVRHWEAATLFKMIKNSKHASLKEFAAEELKSQWDTDTDGAYTWAKGKKYLQTILDVLHGQGLVDKHKV